MSVRVTRWAVLFYAALGASPAAAQSQPPAATFVLPTVTVTAQKVPEDPLEVPVSVTVVSKDTLDGAAVRMVSDAAEFAPNTYFNEFTARKLSNARFRGVGSSPNNPGVTTYIDGVPQLNANSSSIELMDVDQIEFVRGSFGALFGRNTLGGLVNITSSRPSFKAWTGSVTVPFGNFSSGELRASASGPLVSDKLALGVGVGYSRRDGYTTNDVTGNALDGRSAFFGKTQLVWTPTARLEARVMFTRERARDGDYALNDLGALRAKPFHASRDFEGSTERDVAAPTFRVNYAGTKVDVSSTTGVVWWKTHDSTDLDYTPLPLITRNNAEKDLQFTEEFRATSANGAAVRLSDSVTLKWQAGVFLFTQSYEQDAVNNFSPFVLSPFLGFPIAQHSPQSTLDDSGVGVYGHTTWTFSKKLDVIVGVRGDHEHKEANLNTFFSPAIAPPSVVDAQKDFGDVSPQFAVTYHVAPKAMVYGTVTRGFKAGGFNAASPSGSEAYGQEHAWNYEGGVKATGLGGRLTTTIAVFDIDWNDLQVNLPSPAAPGQFYIANAGGATSKGVELEINARPVPGLDLFGGVGYTDARFKAGSVSSGANVGGNMLANAPQHTIDAGLQYTHAVSQAMSLILRADVLQYGAFQYDDANTAGQEAYALTNLRAGVRGKRTFVEGWVRNAFDTHYIPTAFAFPGLAPSGFIGENGAPRTFGLRVGLTF